MAKESSKLTTKPTTKPSSKLPRTLPVTADEHIPPHAGHGQPWSDHYEPPEPLSPRMARLLKELDSFERGLVSARGPDERRTLRHRIQCIRDDLELLRRGLYAGAGAINPSHG